MKGVLYISFLVCMLLGCSDGDSLPDWKKTKQPVLSWRLRLLPLWKAIYRPVPMQFLRPEVPLLCFVMGRLPKRVIRL